MLGNDRGTALIEGLGAVVVLAAFFASLLSAGYLLFARAWIQMQGEKALYCLAEGQPAVRCKRDFIGRANRLLFAGELQRTKLTSHGDRWALEVDWKWNGYGFNLHRELSLKWIARNRDLPL